MAASTAEIVEIWRGVAPTSRIEAKRSSRRTADKSAGRRNEDQDRQHEGHDRADENGFEDWPAPDHALAARAVREAAVDRSDFDGGRLLRELADVVADDDDQRVRRRQPRAGDGAHQLTGVAVTQLVGGLGAQEAHQRRRGEVPARTRQARHSGRDWGVRPGRSDVDLVDELTAERVGARFPPQAAGGRGRRVGCTAEFSQAPRSLWAWRPLMPAKAASIKPTPRATAAAVTRTRRRASRPLAKVRRRPSRIMRRPPPGWRPGRRARSPRGRRRRRREARGSRGRP